MNEYEVRIEGETGWKPCTPPTAVVELFVDVMRRYVTLISMDGTEIIYRRREKQFWDNSSGKFVPCATYIPTELQDLLREFPDETVTFRGLKYRYQ